MNTTWRLVRAALCAVITLAFITASAVSFPADHQAPSRPTNLHVTAVTSWSVSLAWNPSTDNSGQFTYRVICSNGQSITVPQNQTFATFSSGLQHMGTYSFTVRAVDGSNNWSQPSNAVSAALPQDTTPPAVPVITATDVGPTHISLSWTSNDIGPVIYRLYKDGVVYGQPSSATSTTIYLLQPESTHTFTAEARDSAGNWSPMGRTIRITTEAADPDDVTAPTVPSNLWGGSFGDGSTEFQLHWTPSIDDVTPQQFIIYRVYINGDLSSITVGTTSLTDYGDEHGPTLIEVTASDEAGNESVAGSVIFNL